jgi:hypothetical protein
MTDPKARKVILIEHPLLPLHIKELVAKILFDNHVSTKEYSPMVEMLSVHIGSIRVFCFKSSLIIAFCGENNWPRS